MRYMFRLGALVVFGSLILVRYSVNASPYFSQIGSVQAKGVAKWRKQMTTAESLSARLYACLLLFRKLAANNSASPAPPPVSASRYNRCLPGTVSNQSSCG